MNKKKLYFVFGGEACGNHLATNLLVWAGIKKGTEVEDIIKPIEATEKDLPIVYRRSFPHGGVWNKIDDFSAVVKLVKTNSECPAENEIMVIVPIRSWDSAINSSLKRGHSGNKNQAIYKLKRAYQDIFWEITKHKLDYFIFSFDEATRNAEHYLRHFYEMAGIEITNEKIKEISKRVTNENDKFKQKDYKLNRPTDNY